MRKKRSICLIMLAVFLLAGCKKEPQETNTVKVTNSIAGDMANAEEGTYLLKWNPDTNAYIPYFYDLKNELLTPLCNEVNCKHDNEKCHAWTLGTNGAFSLKQILYDQGEIYLAYAGEARFMIAKANKDGTNLKKVYESEDGVYLNGLAMCEGQLIIGYMLEAKDENGVPTGSSTINLMSAYDLDTKQETILVNEKQEQDIMCYPIGVLGKELYYIVTDLSKEPSESEVFLYDGDTKENKKIETEQQIQGGLLFEGKSYSWNEDKQMVQSYDLKTGKTEEVVSVNGTGIQVSALPGGVLSLRKMIDLGDGTGAMGYQYYDLKKGELIFDDFQTDIVMSGSDGVHYFGTNSEDKLVGTAIDQVEWKVLE